MTLHLDPDKLGTSFLQPGHVPQPVQTVSPPPPRASVGRSILKTSGLVTLALFGGLFILERLAPLDWRPSTMIGAFSGREQSAQILSAIEAKRAEIAVAQEEAARAQQEILVLQANNERVTKAYEALYQRGNIMAAQWAEGAKQTLMMNTQAKIEGLRGRIANSADKDRWGMLCDGMDLLIALGNGRATGCGDQLRASARDDRQAMQAEIIADYKAQSQAIASTLRDWAQGLDDPASVVAAKHHIDGLIPKPRALVPPPPLNPS